MDYAEETRAENGAQMIPPEDLAELQPVRRYLPTEHVSDQLAAGGAVEPAYAPDLWDWLSYAAPWFGLGSILCVVLLVVLEIAAPWK